MALRPARPVAVLLALLSAASVAAQGAAPFPPPPGAQEAPFTGATARTRGTVFSSAATVSVVHR